MGQELSWEMSIADLTIRFAETLRIAMITQYSVFFLTLDAMHCDDVKKRLN